MGGDTARTGSSLSFGSPFRFTSRSLRTYTPVPIRLSNGFQRFHRMALSRVTPLMLGMLTLSLLAIGAAPMAAADPAQHCFDSEPTFFPNFWFCWVCHEATDGNPMIYVNCHPFS